LRDALMLVTVVAASTVATTVSETRVLISGTASFTVCR
jgi:hypothetical protein